MKYITIIALVFGLSLSSSATPQILDKIIIEKDTFFLYNSPLAKVSNLIEKDTNFINRRILTTANKRGYVATWELVENQIYLIKISDSPNGKLEADFQTIFENQYFNQKIKASWINEEIIAHSKYPMQGYRIGFSNVFEQEIILKVENGKLISTEKLNNTWAKKPNDITSALNTYIIKKLPRKLRKEVLKNKLDYEFYTYIIFDSNLKVNSIEFTETECETTELHKIITKFNEWKFVYKKGKLMNEYAVKVRINANEIEMSSKCR